MKIRYLILFILTGTSLTTLSQSVDSVKLKKWTERQAKAKHQRDSLSAIFYATPPYYIISFELNHKETAIPDNAKFYATSGEKNFKSRKTGQNKYEFDDLPDSVKFVFEFDTIKVATGFEKKTFYKNGAELRFGYLTMCSHLKSNGTKGRKTRTSMNGLTFDNHTLT